MRDRVVLLAGAGNVRCAPPVLASLATWYPDDVVTLSLFDANLERLDLIDRLARKLFDDFNRDLLIRSSTDLSEASEGTTDLVLMLNEDGSRRMVGAVSSDKLQAFEEMEEDPFELRKGDRNRPTPPEQLSPATRNMLSQPKATGPRDEVILAAANLVLEQTPDSRTVSLMRGVVLPSGTEHLHLNWPEPIDEMKLPLIPHQILRWIYCDEPTNDLIEAGRNNPFRAWLED
ncbi:MAG: hypothetical protein KDC26_08760 [Armatimonadetes bacterium]|nr:hypothetical protein [Armatimonadota bacterium]